jgi:ribosomal protein S18 acetylase RimI-like enzyme
MTKNFQGTEKAGVEKSIWPIDNRFLDGCHSLKFLDSSHLEEVIKLQEIIAMNLPDKEIFRLTTVREFREILRRRESVIGIHSNGSLIAYNIVSIPGKDDDNFGADIGISSEDLCKVAHLKAVVVHPEFRGCGLQRKLAAIHLKVLRDAGFEHVCSTVSPKNCISVENHLASGFVIRGLKVKYGGWLRYIMYKNVCKVSHHLIKSVAEVESVGSSDLERQKDLLNRGFVGYEMIRCNNTSAGDYSINFRLASNY